MASSLFTGTSGSSRRAWLFAMALGALPGITWSAERQAAVVKPTIVKLAAGFSHTYVLQSDGQVWAWGNNQLGALGDGGTAARPQAWPVPGRFVDIASGGGNAVALHADGTVWAWGRDDWGQQGDGGPVMGMPVRTPTPNGVTAVGIRAGTFHVYATQADGSLRAWGFNEYGQLADGSTVNRSAPVTMGFGSEFVQIAAGTLSNFGIKADGSLWAWGYNDKGQLGDGTLVPRRNPVKVGDGFSTVVAADESVFALQRNGSLWAWGNNDTGQLGDGSTERRSLPVRIGRNFRAVAVGGYGSHKWYSYDAFGDRIEHINPGGTHVLAIKTDNSLWAWGENSFGQLGDGTRTARLRPVRIGGNFAMAAAGGYGDNAHSVAVRLDGSLWAWGGNLHGEVGDGSFVDKLVPTRIKLRRP